MFSFLSSSIIQENTDLVLVLTGSLTIFFFLVFLGLHPRHMEVPRLRAELEL